MNSSIFLLLQTFSKLGLDFKTTTYKHMCTYPQLLQNDFYRNNLLNLCQYKFVNILLTVLQKEKYVTYQNGANFLPH